MTFLILIAAFAAPFSLLIVWGAGAHAQQNKPDCEEELSPASLCAHLKRIAAAGRVRGLGRIRGLRPQVRAPVSYTHLDVYKRQSEACCCGRTG